MVNKNMTDNKGRKSGEMFWTKEQMEDLLHHYENEVELWDISNSNYSKKDARQRRWRELKKLWIITSLVKFSYVAFMY
jgi:hypothetical protein